LFLEEIENFTLSGYWRCKKKQWSCFVNSSTPIII
jgi:HKD family nuclease